MLVFCLRQHSHVVMCSSDLYRRTCLFQGRKDVLFNDAIHTFIDENFPDLSGIPDI